MEQLSEDVKAILQDWENMFYMSAESLKELIVAYRNKNLLSKFWKTPEDMLFAIKEEFGIQILPLEYEQYLVYSKLILNEAEDHKDPSDHVIISHAISLKMPLISSDRKFAFYRKQGLELIYNER